MFGNFSNIVPIARKHVDPDDIPPPTPINLPSYQPLAQDDSLIDPSASLSELLQRTDRPNHVLGPISLSAIGLNLQLEADLQQLIPDESLIPDFDKWDSLTLDQATEDNAQTQRPLSNGSLSPGCREYLERCRELSIANEDGFRTVRRIPPPKGKQPARLGTAYHFFRFLEQFTEYWDDPTSTSTRPLSPELTPDDSSTAGSDTAAPEHTVESMRTSSGSSMLPEYRVSLTHAFVKLVAYDFGCDASLARIEPRLQLTSPHKSPHPRKSYSPSPCSFICQTSKTREAARSGILHGPVAAVSTRNTTAFDTPSVVEAQSVDLAREIVAGLIAAQHRARQGREERRFGEGEWWTTKSRWGGGSGGPIGREIDRYAAQGDSDHPERDQDGMPVPITKKARKGMSIYDNYRMVRPPSSTWDKRLRYEAIGKQKGTNYDDIFVVSSLFHHISVLRIRVPQRLLEVLEGAPEPDASRRSWGTVPAWRSPWFDLFDVQQRLAAIKVLWSMMAYQMRADTEMAKEDAQMDDG